MTEPSRILVVDDEESIRKTTSMNLSHGGYVVDTAENGKEAIAKSHSRFYNLALIDFRLPDIEGIELLSKLRETTPKMAKIILTGFPALQNAVAAINQGVDAYLIKPVDTEELLRVVKEQLDKQKREAQFDQEKVAQYVETRSRQLAREYDLEEPEDDRPD